MCMCEETKNHEKPGGKPRAEARVSDVCTFFLLSSPLLDWSEHP